MTRLVLAATLAASYGIYGPAFELCENRPREPGSEEYLDSEKYEIKQLGPRAPRQPARAHRPASTASAARTRRCRATGACASTPSTTSSSSAYSKTHRRTAPTSILVVVNLDPHHPQSGWVELAAGDARARRRTSRYQVHDLLTGARYLWSGPRNYVELDPASAPGPHLPRPAPRPHRTRLRLLPVMGTRSMAQNRRRSCRSPTTRLWYKDAVIYELHVRAFRDSNGDGIGDFRGLTEQARLPPGSRRHRHLAAALLPLAAADDGYDIADYTDVHPAYGTHGRLPALPARGPRARAAGDHRAGPQPHLRPAPLVPAGAARAAGQPRGATSTSGATPPSATRTPGSSSRTSRPRTGPGTRWPRPTTGTASTPTSRT